MTAAELPPLLLVGAGRMGGALFSGWAARGLAPSVLADPAPAPGVARAADTVVAELAAVPQGFAPSAIILAVKPQMADPVLAALHKALRPGTVVLSIMAGRRIVGMAQAIGGHPPIVRAMPNTPAAIGQGMTVACTGPGVTEQQRALCDTLLAAVGDVAWLDHEDQVDAATAISGSGPAYVFLLAELLEQASIDAGLPPKLARLLARRTVSGSGALLSASEDDAAALRRAVTSPRGVTEQALAVLMAADAWPAAMRKAIEAGAARARELAS